MYYKGKNAGYVDVQNFDVNGTGYIRKRGQVGIRLDNSAIKTTACNSNQIQNAVFYLPLKLVVAVPKNNLEDSPFVDDILASNLISVLQQNLNPLAVSLNVNDINVIVTNYDTDDLNIWISENKGIEFDENKLFRFSYIAIDFDIEIKGNLSCLENCNNGYLEG